MVHIFDSYYDVFIRLGNWVDGLYIDDDVQLKLQIKASIQPTKNRDLVFFPEGSRIEDTKVAYSVNALSLDDQQYNPGNYDIRLIYIDEFTNQVPYRIVNCVPWKNSYYRYMLQEIRFDNDIPTPLRIKKDELPDN